MSGGADDGYSMGSSKHVLVVNTGGVWPCLFIDRMDRKGLEEVAKEFEARLHHQYLPDLTDGTPLHERQKNPRRGFPVPPKKL